MKILGYILSLLLLCFIAWQVYSAYSNKKFENMDQQLIGSINNVNFKTYSQYTLASVKMDGKSLNNAKGKFSVLANYIFGGNSDKKQIAMTSPVIYNMSNYATFSFIMPDNYEVSNLPSPNSKEISFKTNKNQCIASITFGGFVNNENCKENYLKLLEVLNANDISHSNDYMLAVYNSPYQIINRKNEIWIEVNKDEILKKLDIK